MRAKASVGANVV